MNIIDCRAGTTTDLKPGEVPPAPAPKKHNYTVEVREGKWVTYVAPATNYGYYEHDEMGDGGGLWFETTKSARGLKVIELMDFDGRACLPPGVAKALRSAGFVVGPDFD